MPRAVEPRKSGSWPWVAMVLGVLGILSGLAGNSAVLLLGVAATALGVWARTADRKDIALWGVGIGALAVVGYLGIISQQASS